MNRAETAQENFLKGYTCAQSVLLAFSDLTGLDEKTAVRLTAGFGGGVCGRREMCGAISGMLMAAGLILGSGDAMPAEEKKAFYARMNDLVKTFEAQNGTIICRELLGEAANAPAGAQRTAEYYASRPCGRLIGEAAAILDAALLREKEGAKA